MSEVESAMPEADVPFERTGHWFGNGCARS